MIFQCIIIVMYTTAVGATRCFDAADFGWTMQMASCLYIANVFISLA